MTEPGRGAVIARSPAIACALTALIVIVAVLLAYTADAGLPYVPVDRVSVDVTEPIPLSGNEEVRIGGHRVGVVESVDAISARLNLKLDQEVEPLPVDSSFRVRSGSSDSGTYLEIIRGDGGPAPEGFVFDG